MKNILGNFMSTRFGLKPLDRPLGDITDMYYSSAQPQAVQSLTVILMESAHVGVERFQMTIQHGKVKMNWGFFLCHSQIIWTRVHEN